LFEVSFLIVNEFNYLLVGVDLKVVVIDLNTGSKIFSIGLFSYFLGFDDNSESAFTIKSELDDYLISKKGLYISQSIPHQLQI
jgi:hypothetical protein